MMIGIQRTAALLALILLGFVLKRFHIVQDSDRRTFGKLFSNVTFPAVVITSYTRIERQFFLLWMIPLGLVICLCLMAVHFVDMRKSSREVRAFSLVNCSSLSIGSFALPFLQGYFQTSQLIPVLLFDIGNGFMAFTGSAMAGKMAISTEKNGRLKEALHQMAVCIPMWAYLISLILYVTACPIPDALYDGISLVADAHPVFVMLTIGMSLQLPAPRSSLRKSGKLLMLHYCAVTVLALFAYWMLPFEETVRKILVIILFCPLSASGPVNTAALGLDQEEAGLLNTISILIGIVAITMLIPFLGLNGETAMVG